jgi:hypothetical protein
MFQFIRNKSILIIIIFILSACNLPSNAPVTEQPNTVFTAAALTVQAQLTPSPSFSTPTLPVVIATNTTTVVTIPPTVRPPSTVQPTAMCDLAQFVRDVTIPDGSTYAPGATFTKTWRLRNAGTCTWSGYVLVFDSGDAMNGTSPTTIGTVGPGQEVDVSVTLTAPATVGSYRGFWRVRNPSGVFLPVLNGTQGRSFFVDIKVAVTSSGFDMHTRATEATWATAAGSLTFGGPDTNIGGFAMYRNNQALEDGSNPAKVLEMYPQMINDGVIRGLYPSYTVVAGEHFKAKIGFLSPCPGGSVKFQLNYEEAGVLKPLGEWTDTCDGTLKDVDFNLSSISGKSVRFSLAVLANGPATEDKAVWVSPRVELP